MLGTIYSVFYPTSSGSLISEPLSVNLPESDLLDPQLLLVYLGH